MGGKKIILFLFLSNGVYDIPPWKERRDEWNEWRKEGRLGGMREVEWKRKKMEREERKNEEKGKWGKN